MITFCYQSIMEIFFKSPSFFSHQEAITEYKGTVITVSHDRYFIRQIFNRVIEIKNCNLQDYAGDYNVSNSVFYSSGLIRKLRRNRKELHFNKQKQNLKGPRMPIDGIKVIWWSGFIFTELIDQMYNLQRFCLSIKDCKQN